VKERRQESKEKEAKERKESISKSHASVVMAPRHGITSLKPTGVEVSRFRV
jgi:hypothetical protein